MYQGLARRYLRPLGFLMRPLLDGGTLAGLTNGPLLMATAKLLEDDARWILAAWRDRLLDEDDVRSWSAEMLEVIPAVDVPEWLLDLCTLGPIVCMNKPSSDFLHVPELDFRSALSLHVRTCDLENSGEVDALIAWICRACMGEDLDRPEVRLGYLLDHDLNDCGRPDWARDALANELPALLGQLAPVSETVLRIAGQSRARRHAEAKRVAG